MSYWSTTPNCKIADGVPSLHQTILVTVPNCKPSDLLTGYHLCVGSRDQIVR